jgi:hypothetical protein
LAHQSDFDRELEHRLRKTTLPVGARAGRLVKIGDKLPVNLLIAAYRNALRPDPC